MTPQTIRILISGALFVHGVGHTLGIWKPARSLFFLKVPEPTLRLVGGTIWVIIAIGFIASAMSFFGVLLPADWWRPVATIFAVVSLVSLILFGRSWPIFNLFAAAVFNIAVLVSLLYLHWPPLEMFNR